MPGGHGSGSIKNPVTLWGATVQAIGNGDASKARDRLIVAGAAVASLFLPPAAPVFASAAVTTGAARLANNHLSGSSEGVSPITVDTAASTAAAFIPIPGAGAVAEAAVPFAAKFLPVAAKGAINAMGKLTNYEISQASETTSPLPIATPAKLIVSADTKLSPHG